MWGGIRKLTRLWKSSMRHCFFISIVLGWAFIFFNWSNHHFVKRTYLERKQVSSRPITTISINQDKVIQQQHQQQQQQQQQSQPTGHIVGFLQKPRNSSLFQTVVERFVKKTDDIQEHSVKRTITSILRNKVFIYSALSINSSEKNRTNWDHIVLNGWEHKVLDAVNLTCCIMYDNNQSRVVTQPVLLKRPWEVFVTKVTLRVLQWVCPNTKQILPVSVTLTMNNKTCPINTDVYVNVKPVYKLQPKTLGVCGKLVYNSVNASSIIEWFEFQKRMKVDKILVYTNNLNVEAKRVLEYYSKIGIAETREFELGGIDEIPRKIGIKNYQGWSDEQVTVFDCQSRLSGATYIAVYDLDEFIFPFASTDYKQMLHNLTSLYANAAGFTFRSQIYVKDWHQTNPIPGSSLVMASYTRRTYTMMDRVKNFVRVDRLQTGRMFTHGFWPKRKFKKTIVPESIAVIKHYRSCRKEWLRHGGEICFRNLTQIQDNSMLSMARKLDPEINKVKQTLGLAT